LQDLGGEDIFLSLLEWSHSFKMEAMVVVGLSGRRDGGGGGGQREDEGEGEISLAHSVGRALRVGRKMRGRW
jgi:hypothetical protein